MRLGIAVLLAGCGGSDLPIFPDLLLPQVGVTEGDAATFELRYRSAPDADYSGAIEGDPYLSVAPTSFHFTPTSYSELVTITALDDNDLGDKVATIGAMTYGDLSTTAVVQIVDDDTLNIVVTDWSLTLPPGGHTTLGVRLTQPPPSPVHVTLTTDPQYVGIDATALDFDASNFATFQSVAVDGLSAGGEQAIVLDASGLTTRRVPVAITN